MGIVESMAREIGNKSREFYEFVLPPVDMHVGDSVLTVTIDIPGFSRDQISLSISDGILSIKAAKPDGEEQRGTVCSQRPRIIDKRIRLPVRVSTEQEKAASAKYADGVLVLSIPVRKDGSDVPIE